MDVRLVNSDDNWAQYQLVGDISSASITGAGKTPLSPLNLPGDQLTTHIVFDLIDATFLDSSGIGWLLSINRAAKEHGYEVVVHSVPPLINRVFSMMRLGEVIPVVDNLEQARNHIASVNG